MSEAQSFFTAMMLFSLPFWLPKVLRSRPEWAEPEESEDSDIDYEALRQKIRELNQMQDRIDTLEKLICDIENCEPGVHHNAFQLKWLSETDGKNTSYDFWADGETDANNKLLELAESELEQLRSSLLEQIEDLQI